VKDAQKIQQEPRVYISPYGDLVHRCEGVRFHADGASFRAHQGIPASVCCQAFQEVAYLQCPAVKVPACLNMKYVHQTLLCQTVRLTVVTILLRSYQASGGIKHIPHGYALHAGIFPVTRGRSFAWGTGHSVIKHERFAVFRREVRASGPE
jgi:hypothetical protein